MQHPLGFSTGFYYLKNTSYTERFETMLNLGDEVVEVHFSDIFNNPEFFTQEAQALVNKFSYRSIHLPTHFCYPSRDAEQLLALLIPVIGTINPQTLVLHPDVIEDFSWVANTFGSLLAIENMDWRKSIGTTPESLAEIFEKLPTAKWVFDVNHILTLDPTMQLAEQFYQQFKDRLVQYHFSGFGGKELVHSCICETREDILFSAVQNDTAPIILESIPHLPNTTMQDEWDYVVNRLV